MEPVTIRRTVELDITSDVLWDLVSSPTHLAAWLGDMITLDLAPGAVGSINDGGVLRHVHVDAVRPGRELAFTWWPADDPTTASQVILRVDARPDDSAALHITETLLAPAPTQASTIDRAAAWEVRVLSLWACCVAAALVS